MAQCRLALRAWLGDDPFAAHIRLLLNACDRRDRSAVRAQAVRLLVDGPSDFWRLAAWFVGWGTSASGGSLFVAASATNARARNALGSPPCDPGT